MWTARFPLERRTLLTIWMAGWSAVLVIMVADIWMQHHFQEVPFFSEWYFAPRTVSLAFIGAALSIGVFLAFGRWIQMDWPLASRLLLYFPIGATYWLAWSALSALLEVLVWPGPPDTFGAAFGQALSGWAFNSLLIFGVMALLYEAMLNMRRVSREETRAAHYEAELSRARTAALAAQLDPHFLFNTLHVVSGLMRRDLNAARRILGDLQALLHRSFRRQGLQTVRLGNELHLVERYLRIQQARFGDRLGVELDIDADAIRARIPPLLIQPLVENAIQHGIARQPAGGVVSIEVRRDPSEIVISVTNSGIPQESGTRPSVHERIGLGGVRARLQSVFGDSARLEIHHDIPGTFTATITLPSVGVNLPAGVSESGSSANGGGTDSHSAGWEAPNGDRFIASQPWGWPRWFAVGASGWLGMAVVYHVVLGFRRWSTGLPFYSSWQQLLPNSLIFLAGALFTPFLVLLLWKARARIRSVPLVVALYTVTGLAFWGVWTSGSFLLVSLVLGGGLPFSQLLVMSAFINLALFAAIALMVEGIWQLNVARRKAVEAAALRADLLTAETAALRSKVSPFLLFDSLALASELMEDDVRAARNVMSDVSELLRVSLSRNGDPFIPLNRELDHLRSVLDIHVGRGRGPAPLELELTGGAGDRLVPCLVLQPLAGKLAQGATADSGKLRRILIRCEPSGPDRLKLFMRVEYDSNPEPTVDTSLSGAEADQIREWLATAYGVDHGVQVETSLDGTSSLEFIAPPAEAPVASQ